MYTNFELKKIDHKNRITGYLWDIKEPQKVVALIHGVGEHDGRYNRVAGYFNEAGIAMVGMDLRGHGQSMGPKGHCAPRKEILKDIDELVEYIQIRYPGVPIVLYGHSMGGNLALDYKARGTYNKEMAGFIVSAPWVLLTNPFPPALVNTVKVLCKVAPKMAVSAGVNEKDLGNPKSVKPYKEDPLVHNKISLQTAVDNLTIGEALAKGEHEDNGGSKGIPFLLMHGDDDKICSVEGSRLVAAHNPDVQYVEWPGYYHEIHNGNATVAGEDVIEKMVDFITLL